VVVLSEKAAESFRGAGFPDEKLFYLPRGVDVERFKPGMRPPIFRAIFSGALIKRKGIHHLLEAWHRLNLRDAELWLLGSIHDEAKPYLKQFGRENVRVLGFKRDLENYLNQGSVYVFPSRLEGSAKTIYEAAASGLPMITTRSGRRGTRWRRRNYRSAGRCRCNRGRDRASVSASRDCREHGGRSATTRGGKFHVGPLSDAFVRRLRKSDPNGAINLL